MRENGWVLSAYTMPPDAQEVAIAARGGPPAPEPQRHRACWPRHTIKVCDYLDKHGGTATAPTLHDAHKKSEAKC